MLMALLPMAGWASPISGTDIKAESPYFGYLPNVKGTGLTEGTDFQIVGYYTNSTLETELTEAQVMATDANTSLVVLVKGLNTYDGTAKLTFEIKPMALKITGTPKSKEYGKNDPTGNDFFTITKIEENVTSGEDLTEDLKSLITMGRISGKNVGEYAYTASCSNTNYSIASTDIVKVVSGTESQAKFEITTRAFTTTNIKVDEIAGTFTYTGKEQKPAVTVADKTSTLNTNGTLTLDTDYEVTYSGNVQHGTATVTITGKGNYSTASITKNFTIGQAPLVITPKAEKNYDGTADLPTSLDKDNNFDYQGWVNGEGTSLISAIPNLASSDATLYAGTYKLAVATSGTTSFTITGDNYKQIFQEGTFKIKPIDLKIKVTDESKAYGVTPDKAITKEGTTITISSTDDWTLIKDVVEVIVAESAETTGANKGKFKMTPQAKVNPYDAETETSNYNTFEAKLKTLASYNVTWTPGYLSVSKALLYVGLNAKKYKLTKVYDGEVISLAIPADKSDLTVLGWVNGDTDAKLNISNVDLTIADNAATVGHYQVEVTGVTAENYDIVPIASDYEITQRPLHVTTYDQVFVVGQAYNLNPSAYKVVSGVEDEGLVDDVKDVFQLNAEVSTTGTPAKATTVQEKDITLVASTSTTPGYVSKFTNYDIIMDATGKAKVIEATTLLALDDTKDVVTTLNTFVTTNITGTATKKEGVTVTFNPRNLNVEKWNVLVLPFDVTVVELSNAFGYAVVDVLDEANSNGNMSFKLKVSGKIYANTPFMIYPSDAKQNLNQVVFENRTINKQTYTATVAVKDAKNNKFVGTYKTANIYGEKYYYMKAGEWKRAGLFSETNPAPVNPLRAYIDLSESTAAAPIITIEEPDGNTTAIKVLDVDTMETYSVDGWYTLNGVKLQGIPTQKGIYINNGKKVVVK